jgi:hypothetical protein
VDNLAEAVALVRAGGTIRVLAGSYVTEDVLIDKPLRLEGTGSAEIVNIVGTTSPLIAGIGEGLVSISDLAFRNDAPDLGGSNRSSSIALEDGFQEVRIEDNSFVGQPGVGTLVLQRSTTTTVNPSVAIRRNTFRDGFTRMRLVNSGGLVTVAVEQNSVTDFSNTGFVSIGTVIDAFFGENFQGVLHIQSNDFSDYARAIQGSDQSFSDGSLTCNWWGSPSAPGPGTVAGLVGAGVFTPWALAPGAGTSTTSCAGGL